MYSTFSVVTCFISAGLWETHPDAAGPHLTALAKPLCKPGDIHSCHEHELEGQYSAQYGEFAFWWKRWQMKKPADEMWSTLTHIVLVTAYMQLEEGF